MAAATAAIATALVAVRVLFKHQGENSTTSCDPVAEWGGQADLTETKTVCVSADFDMLTQTRAYEVREVELPEWLSADEWARTSIRWKYTWGAGVDPTWPEHWQRGLAPLTVAEKLACSRLLKTKKFRSDFRRSLHDQLVAWLETDPEERTYGSPFSRKQWGCLINRYIAKDACRLEQALYWNRSAEGRDVTQEVLAEKAA